jgi:hypothetical protein
VKALLAGVLTLGLLAGCSSEGTPSTGDRTITSTTTQTRPAAQTFTPAPATSVAPLPPGAAPPAGEAERACPYIASTPSEDPNVNVADIEGDHVYRTTVLTRHDPVGCRFYFYAGPYQAIADIVPRRFPDAVAAHNAMVLTAEAGSDAQGKKDMLPGIDAVLFRTAFFGPDGERDWACAFAKGKLLVVVHTQRSDTSYSALLLAKAVAAKI